MTMLIEQELEFYIVLWQTIPPYPILFERRTTMFQNMSGEKQLIMEFHGLLSEEIYHAGHLTKWKTYHIKLDAVLLGSLPKVKPAGHECKHIINHLEWRVIIISRQNEFNWPFNITEWPWNQFQEKFYWARFLMLLGACIYISLVFISFQIWLLFLFPSSIWRVMKLR